MKNVKLLIIVGVVVSAVLGIFSVVDFVTQEELQEVLSKTWIILLILGVVSALVQAFSQKK
jgi:hypothetical protein